jgi:hypothetical protein
MSKYITPSQLDEVIDELCEKNDDRFEKSVFKGTLEEWNALSSSEKARYDAKAIINDTIHTNAAFTGATSQNNGNQGLVPQPLAGDEDKVLQGDGTWGKKLQIDVVVQNNVYGYIGANNTFVPFKSQADIDAAVSAARVGDATAADVVAGKTFTNASTSGLTGTFESQEKTVTASRSDQEITPDLGKWLSKVTVNKYPDASGTYICGSNDGSAASNDMGADNNYRYIDATAIYNAGATASNLDMKCTLLNYIESKNDQNGTYSTTVNVDNTDNKYLIVVVSKSMNPDGYSSYDLQITNATSTDLIFSRTYTGQYLSGGSNKHSVMALGLYVYKISALQRKYSLSATKYIGPLIYYAFLLEPKSK